MFTGQDNWANPSEPTEALTFSQYGLTAYEVQCWDGSGWVTVAGGSVTGNDRVWRRFSFAAVVMTKVRVLTQRSVDGYSRVTELEAWGGGVAAAQGAEVRWLVADHLGTPRMVVDATGMWAGISRHDYLPFGEELSAGTGGRQIAQGYGGGDNVRQKFTQKERDTETGLDYIYARYYASTQGRFTSCDPIVTSKEHAVNPQRWNAYTYVLNSPLGLTDPTGKNGQGKSGVKVIDVFITHQSEERKPHSGGNWTGLIEKARQRRIVMRVFYRTEAGTGESEPTTAKMTASLASPGRVVIIAGHSDASHEVEGVGRANGSNVFTGNGFIGPGGAITHKGGDNPSTTVEPLPEIKASMVIVAVCDISGGVSAITSNMSPGSTFIYNDAGSDGLTTLPADEMSAYAAAEVLINGGTAEQVRGAMQNVVTAHKDDQTRFGPVNRGDQIRVVKPKSQ